MSVNHKISMILDTDPGIDDAVALAAALFLPTLDLKLVTTVAGNVSVDKTTLNAQKLLTFYGKQVDLAQGAYRPLLRELDNAEHIHGHSGLDGFEFPTATTPLLSCHAVEAMRDVLMASAEKITLVPIGPLTNIALLLLQYPDCRDKIERIVLMGGSASRGNHTPNAEFNIFIDPEAAAQVFASGIPIVMCGLDVTNQATVTPEMLVKMPQLSQTGKMLHALFSHYRGGSMQKGLKMHDLCAIAYLVRPELFTTQAAYVAVETQGELTRGTTCVDLQQRWSKAPNAQVCVSLDVEGFRDWFLSLMAICR